MTHWQRILAPLLLLLVLWTPLTSCGGGNGLSGPIPADEALLVQALILEEALNRNDLHSPVDQIAAICVGLGGGDDPQPPPPAFLSEFEGQEPSVVGIGACGRSVDPESPFPMIRAPGGNPGLIVVIDSIPGSGNQSVGVKIEKTGAEARALECELRMIVGRREVRAVSAPAARPTERSTGLPRTTSWRFAHEVESCEWSTPVG